VIWFIHFTVETSTPVIHTFLTKMYEQLRRRILLSHGWECFACDNNALTSWRDPARLDRSGSSAEKDTAPIPLTGKLNLARHRQLFDIAFFPEMIYVKVVSAPTR